MYAMPIRVLNSAFELDSWIFHIALRCCYNIERGEGLSWNWCRFTTNLKNICPDLSATVDHNTCTSIFSIISKPNFVCWLNAPNAGCYDPKWWPSLLPSTVPMLVSIQGPRLMPLTIPSGVSSGVKVFFFVIVSDSETWNPAYACYSNHSTTTPTTETTDVLIASSSESNEGYLSTKRFNSNHNIMMHANYLTSVSFLHPAWLGVADLQTGRP